jgi:3-oxoacid CoA-transferase
VIFQEHNSKNGAPKILKECSLPLTGKNCVDMIVTEKGVFEVDQEKGLTLTEKAEEVTIEDIVQSTGCIFRVAEDLKPMQQV